MAASLFRLPRIRSLLRTIFAILLLCIVPISCGKPTTLPQLFPALSGLSDTPALQIVIGWMGLSRLSPISAGYSLKLQNDQFEGVGRFKLATATATRPIVVPREPVRAFLIAVGQVELVEKEYVARIEHTDDYPSLGFAVDTEQGPLKIETQSQPRRPESGSYLDRTPWAIYYLGRTFVVTASDLDRAFEILEPHLQYDSIHEELRKELLSNSGAPR
jgi:hypothetical protein